jgi:hypothetical protein
MRASETPHLDLPGRHDGGSPSCRRDQSVGPAIGRGNATNGSPIVMPAWLHERLGDAGRTLAQICSELDEDDYSDGHIPGARWWY